MILNKKEWNGKDTFQWFVLESNTSEYALERGWGNGYAVVDPNNKLHGLSESEVMGMGVSIESEIAYSGKMEYIKGKEHWVIGFDTAHFGDSIEKWPKSRVEFVAQELARQVEKFN